MWQQPNKNKMPEAALYMGLMSGTSMDSMDAVLADFSSDQPDIIATATQLIDPNTKQQLLNLCGSFDQNGNTTQTALLQMLDKKLALDFSRLALNLLNKATVSANSVKAIGSHGQTVFHLPPQLNKHGFSLQIGNAQLIADQTNISTVGDFRNADMQQGGQGAPLVPAFHKTLFSSPTKNRVIINIGGMANITILPTNGKVIGFDTGPGNVLLDHWCQQHTGKAFDEGGHWGAQGKICLTLLEAFLTEPFFKQRPPKSTGRELFNQTWLQKRLRACATSPTAMDVQNTLTVLTARTISQSIKQYAQETQEVFVCGGGAHNQFLIQLLKEELMLPIASTEALGVNPNWVEATAFAWLAKQTYENKPGNLPDVTGAKAFVVLGKTCLPNRA